MAAPHISRRACLKEWEASVWRGGVHRREPGACVGAVGGRVSGGVGLVTVEGGALMCSARVRVRHVPRVVTRYSDRQCLCLRLCARMRDIICCQAVRRCEKFTQLQNIVHSFGRANTQVTQSSLFVEKRPHQSARARRIHPLSLRINHTAYCEATLHGVWFKRTVA
jgi:hypothetical protein